MIQNDQLWSDIIKRFNTFHEKLREDLYGDFVAHFFDKLKDDCTNNNFERWQIEELQVMISDVIMHINQLKEQVKQEKIETTENFQKLNNYLKTNNLPIK